MSVVFSCGVGFSPPEFDEIQKDMQDPILREKQIWWLFVWGHMDNAEHFFYFTQIHYTPFFKDSFSEL